MSCRTQQAFFEPLESRIVLDALLPEAPFDHRIFHPEGFSSQRIEQTVEISNPNNQVANFQIIVRYERGERDQLIFEGELPPQGRDSIVISPPGQVSTLVRNHEPYAFEIWSTLPLAADLRHNDFGAFTRESFFSAAVLPNQTLMQEWTFAQSAIGGGDSDVYILWQNTTQEDTTVTVTFYFENNQPLAFDFPLEALRRGGVNIARLGGLPATEGFVGAQVSADVPIVASMSRYDRVPSAPLAGEGGRATLGTFGGGSTVGIASAARRGGTVEPITIVNPTTSVVDVTFIVEPRVGELLEIDVLVPPQRTLVLHGAASPAALVPVGEDYTLAYVASQPITAGFINPALGGSWTTFATWAAERIHFSDASFNLPTAGPFGLQGIGIFNAHETATADVRLHFRFDEGPDVLTPTFDWLIPPLHSQERAVNEYAFLLSQVRNGIDDLRITTPYSLEVRASEPVVAQIRQLTGQGITQLGMPLSPIQLLGAAAVD